MGPPVVTGVSPGLWLRGETVDVVITGSFFTGATSVGFSGTGITVNEPFTVNSSSQITASISIDASAAAGVRDVTVTTPLGVSNAYSGFEVVAEAPSAPPGWYEQFTTSNGVSYNLLYGSTRVCQTFTPSTSHYFDLVSLYLLKKGDPNYTLTISLYTTDLNHMPMGSVLCSTTFAASSLTAAATWYEYGFSSGCAVFASNEYAIVLSADGGNSSNTVGVGVNTTGGYSGFCSYSLNGGASWTASVYDVAFKEGQS